MHRVNLERMNIRLDLISDYNSKFNKKIIKKDNTIIERIIVNKKISKRIGKKDGEYISILFDDITDSNQEKIIIKQLTTELRRLLKRKNILGKSVLVVGLGNSYSTPDSLGPKVVDNIITTRHISLIDNLDKKYSIVSKINPDVFANTGIETFDIVNSIRDKINPDYLIVIDSLASTSLNKVNKVIQLTDSGIDPGSGVGNQRKEISKETIGVDVIAIGVPTVVNLNTIVRDIMMEYDVEKVLDNNNNNYLVTPKEIDFVINKLAKVISLSINNSIHNLTK